MVHLDSEGSIVNNVLKWELNVVGDNDRNTPQHDGFVQSKIPQRVSGQGVIGKANLAV